MEHCLIRSRTRDPSLKAYRLLDPVQCLIRRLIKGKNKQFPFHDQSVLDQFRVQPLRFDIRPQQGGNIFFPFRKMDFLFDPICITDGSQHLQNLPGLLFLTAPVDTFYVHGHFPFLSCFRHNHHFCHGPDIQLSGMDHHRRHIGSGASDQPVSPFLFCVNHLFKRELSGEFCHLFIRLIGDIENFEHQLSMDFHIMIHLSDFLDPQRSFALHDFFDILFVVRHIVVFINQKLVCHRLSAPLFHNLFFYQLHREPPHSSKTTCLS